MQPEINYAQIQPASFGESWSISNTRALLDLDKSRPEDESELSAWYQDHYWPAQEALGLAITRHLLHLKISGKLSVAPHSEYVKTRWNRHWTNFVQDPGYVEIEEIVRDFAILAFRDIQLYDLSGNASPESIHQSLVDLIGRGTFEWFDMKSGVCNRSGATLYPAFENWQPTLGTVDHLNRGEFTPLVAGQIDRPHVEHLLIDFPTGELIINDWIRIPEFTQAAHEEEGSSGEGYDSINYAAGRVARTRLYAERLGFVHVSTSTGPTIVQREGRLDAGMLLDEEGVDGNCLGSVCTDLWWTTMIDRGVLASILTGKGLTEQEAQEKIDAFIEESANVITAKVPPGQYHLYFTGDDHTFGNTFQSPDADLSMFDTPMFTLSPHPLRLDLESDLAPLRASRSGQSP